MNTKEYYRNIEEELEDLGGFSFFCSKDDTEDITPKHSLSDEEKAELTLDELDEEREFCFVYGEELGESLVERRF